MTVGYAAIESDEAATERLVTAHAELVKRIAYHLLAKMPPHIDVDDLIQAGMIGLLNAARSFSESKGTNFETYAGIRIRGAMLDEARKANFTPRSTFRHAKQVSQAMRAVEARTNRDARPPEIAAELGVSMEDYHRMLESAAATRMLSLDQLTEDSDRAETLTESLEPGPAQVLQTDQFQGELAEAIAGLPDRERLVLSLYYDEELNLREIGAVLEVTESRVCQIHGQAVARLRARLESWLE